MSFTVEELATVSRAPADAGIEQVRCTELDKLDEQLSCPVDSMSVIAATCSRSKSECIQQDAKRHGFEYDTIETNDRTVTFIWNR